MDGAIIRPLPTVKRILSEPGTLPHIVHLLVTFDPVLVEQVAILLYYIMEDNPKLSTLYTTSVFFILMYTGSTGGDLVQRDEAIDEDSLSSGRLHCRVTT